MDELKLELKTIKITKPILKQIQVLYSWSPVFLKQCKPVCWLHSSVFGRYSDYDYILVTTPQQTPLLLAVTRGTMKVVTDIWNTSVEQAFIP